MTEHAGSDSAPTVPQAASPARWTVETVTAIRYWTPTVLSFRITRPRAFRFTPGHYARLGLADPASGEGQAPVFRPFSMVSAHDAPELEFLAVLVQGGAFSTLLAALREGDPILLEKPSFGFMTVGAFADGRDLWMLATGTGLGPFMSILRDPAVWKRFETLVLSHSVRRAAELAYRSEIEALAGAQPAAGARLAYLPIVTREPGASALAERLPALIESGRLEAAAGATLDLQRSRIMVCGNPEMAAEVRRLLTGRGFRPNRRAAPGQLAFENYW